ncbi:MAG: superoxide dismutase family protein [Pseudomonadota bacterium]|nr:superoxide dismutase family protein [Pseudomonadota bacterium]
MNTRYLACAIGAAVLALGACRESDVRPGNNSDVVLDERSIQTNQDLGQDISQTDAPVDAQGFRDTGGEVTEADILPSEYTGDGARSPDRIAYVTLQPTAGNTVSGLVAFIHEDAASETVRVVGKLIGIPSGEHGMHVHENGNCTGPQASTAGSHYDPDGSVVHGDRTSPARHLGDLGNIVADMNQVATFDFTDDRIKLVGVNSIAQKALIVHASADDLITQPSGNSGDPIACGIITPQENNLVP